MITCPDDNKTQVPAAINLDEIEVQTNEKHSRDIKLDDTLILRMKYPSLTEFIKNNFSTGNMMTVEDTFDLIVSCIEQVYSEEESWSASDCSKKELVEFLDQLTSHIIKVKNPNTGIESDVVLEGLSSFFA